MVRTINERIPEVATMCTYDDACAAAYALDLVGERWGVDPVCTGGAAPSHPRVDSEFGGADPVVVCPRMDSTFGTSVLGRRMSPDGERPQGTSQ
jgi:hypothetical protein